MEKKKKMGLLRSSKDHEVHMNPYRSERLQVSIGLISWIKKSGKVPNDPEREFRYLSEFIPATSK